VASAAAWAVFAVFFRVDFRFGFSAASPGAVSPEPSDPPVDAGAAAAFFVVRFRLDVGGVSPPSPPPSPPPPSGVAAAAFFVARFRVVFFAADAAGGSEGPVSPGAGPGSGPGSGLDSGVGDPSA
jgi:hypothetical protein